MFASASAALPSLWSPRAYGLQDGTMHWPVMFLYDEHGTSDFVAQFSELHTLRQHLEVRRCVATGSNQLSGR